MKTLVRLQLILSILILVGLFALVMQDMLLQEANPDHLLPHAEEVSAVLDEPAVAPTIVAPEPIEPAPIVLSEALLAIEARGNRYTKGASRDALYHYVHPVPEVFDD